jgi:hypothetical protein
MLQYTTMDLKEDNENTLIDLKIIHHIHLILLGL